MALILSSLVIFRARVSNTFSPFFTLVLLRKLESHQMLKKMLKSVQGENYEGISARRTRTASGAFFPGRNRSEFREVE